MSVATDELLEESGAKVEEAGSVLLIRYPYESPTQEEFYSGLKSNRQKAQDLAELLGRETGRSVVFMSNLRDERGDFVWDLQAR